MRPALSKILIYASAGLLLAVTVGLCAVRALAISQNPHGGMTFYVHLGKEDLSPLFTLFNPAPGTVTRVVLGGPAYRAGIKVKDQVLEVQGIPVTQKEEIRNLVFQVPPDEGIRYLIQSGETTREVTLRPVSMLHSLQMMIGFSTGVVTALVFLLFGLLVIWRRPEDHHARVLFFFNTASTAAYLLIPFLTFEDHYPIGVAKTGAWSTTYFAVLAFAIVLTLLINGLILHLALVFPKRLPLVEGRPYLLRWIYIFPLLPLTQALVSGYVVGFLSKKVSQLGVMFGIPVFLVFLGIITGLILYARRSVRKSGWGDGLLRRHLLVSGLLITILSALAFLGAFLLETVGASQSAKTSFIYLNISSLVLAFAALFFLTPALTCLALFFNFRRLGPEEKRQLRWPLWGTITALAGSIMLAVIGVFFQVRMGGDDPWVIVGSDLGGKLLYILIPISFAVGIFKYRVMEIDLIIRRTVVYAIVTGLLLAVFFLLAGGVGGLVVGFAQVRSVWVTVFATLIVAALFIPLYRRVQRFVDLRFTRTQLDYQTALQNLERELSTHTRRSDLLRITAETLIQALRNRSVALFLRSEHDGAFRAAQTIGLPDTFAEKIRLPATHPLVTALDAGEVVRVREVDDVARPLKSAGTELLVPIQGEPGLAGFLAAGRKLHPDPYEPEDLDFLRRSAVLLASALARRKQRLQRKDLETARDIQRGLLPHTIPQLPGVEIAATWQPSREVGGDYYDVVDFGEGRLGLAVADVAGKGMTAALLMSNLQATFRALADPDQEPRVLCKKLNRVLSGHLPETRFITLFYGLFESSCQRLTYCCAGHCPGMLVRKDGKTERLAEGGPFLGLLPDSNFQQGEKILRPGDRLIIFTDGVPEAQDYGENQFGDQRVADLAKSWSNEPAQDLVSRLVTAVRDHSQGELQDDLTLLVLRVL